jgi:hypothetical protein
VIAVSIVLIVAADIVRRWAERRIQALPRVAPLTG